MASVDVSKLAFRNALECAVKKRRIEGELPANGIPDDAGPCREELRLLREIWPGILYCCGRSQQLDIAIDVAHMPDVDSDSDVMARWVADGVARATPIQIKELPNDPRATNTLQSTIDGLRKYGDSRDLVVCIYVARQLEFNAEELTIPGDLRIAELWLLFATEATLDSWCLLGSLLDAREERSEIRFSISALTVPN